MGGGSASNTANQIAQASLNENKRQYEEQQAEKEAQKARAKANAGGALQSANMAYSNMFQQSTDLTSNTKTAYSLLPAGLTMDVLGGNKQTLG